MRLQLLVYAAAIALSFALWRPLFVTYWLLPVALGQPLLRAILLAEHTGCSEDDNPLTNTRTTHTWFLVRFLMWEMPYHAEHHRYPALPFFALAPAHDALGPRLAHVARRGYLGVHADLLRRLLKQRHVQARAHDRRGRGVRARAVHAAERPGARRRQARLPRRTARWRPTDRTSSSTRPRTAPSTPTSNG